MNSTGSPTRLSPASPMKAGTLSQPAPAMDTQKATPAADKALHSRMVQRLHRRYADLLPLLPPGLPRHDSMRTTLFALQQQGHDVGASLRILRQLVLERLAVLDCDAGASLQDVTACMTHLAELALDVACEQAFEQLDALYGAPLKADGSRVNFWIVGMGKLGARELNVSSDIDLIYLYEADGQTAGAPGKASPFPGGNGISFQEYFSKAAKRLHQLIGETTEHGFVFRIDLALRPNGNSGPVVTSLESLAQYLQVQGREWERFAWMKSRIVAPRASIDNHSGRQLRHVVLPFVFRRYLDFNVYESLRVLHDQIRDHAVARSAGRPERANDVKISRGGIREIEFIVQLLQVVRGGQFPELRLRPTLDALPQLARAGCMSAPVAEALAQAYVFLRRAEHRIQYLDDQQTHILPTQDDDLLWIAQTMGYADTCGFMQDLLCHRDIVAREFDSLLSRESNTCKNCMPSRQASSGAAGKASANEHADWAALAAQAAARGCIALQQRLLAWQEHPRIVALRPQTRALVWQLLHNSVQWLAASADEASEAQSAHTRLDDASKEGGVLRFMDWLETILRRQSYLALMLEQPTVHTHVLHILALARWPARYLIRNPGVIDELAHNAMLQQRFEPEAFKHKLTVVIHCHQQIEWLKNTLPLIHEDQIIDIYLKLNTGMNRVGFNCGEADGIYSQLRDLQNIGQISLMTHFANSDIPHGVDEALTQFQQHTHKIRETHPNTPICMANSAAILTHADTHGDWVRPGIMTYGGSPFADKTAAECGLQAAMTLSSELISVRTIHAGESVGYGSRFTAVRDMRIGVVACGYADGYPRHAADGTPVMVDGVRTRLVGRVSMDMLTVDLTAVPNAQVGSTVELWGQNIPIDEVAQASGTIGYELMCALATRVPVRIDG